MGSTNKSSGTSLSIIIIISRASVATLALVLWCEALLVSRLIFLYCFCYVQAVSYVQVHVFIWFSRPILIYYFNWVNLFKTKYRLPRTTYFLTISWFKYRIACNFLRELSAVFRRCLFWKPVLSFAKLCLLSFVPFWWRLSKNFYSSVFSRKSW